MTTLSAAEANADFSNLVDLVSAGHKGFEVARDGRRVAVLISADVYDGLIETLAILENSDAVRAIRTGIEELRIDQVGA